MREKNCGSQPVGDGCVVEEARVDAYGEACVAGSMFIVLDALIKGKGLQALVQVLYQLLEKTRNVVL